MAHYRKNEIPAYDKLNPGDTVETEIGNAAVSEVFGLCDLNHAWGPLSRMGMPSARSSYGALARPVGTVLVPATPANLAQNGAR